MDNVRLIIIVCVEGWISMHEITRKEFPEDDIPPPASGILTPSACW
jgi:hypothetical protein